MEAGVMDFDLFTESETRAISETVLIAAEDGISYPYFSKIYSLMGLCRGVDFIFLNVGLKL